MHDAPAPSRVSTPGGRFTSKAAVYAFLRRDSGQVTAPAVELAARRLDNLVEMVLRLALDAYYQEVEARGVNGCARMHPRLAAHHVEHAFNQLAGALKTTSPHDSAWTEGLPREVV